MKRRFLRTAGGVLAVVLFAESAAMSGVWAHQLEGTAGKVWMAEP